MIASRPLENCRLFMLSPPLWGTGCHCSEIYEYYGHPSMYRMSRIDDPDKLGYRLVEFRCNHLVNIDLFVERACQRNVLEYRDGMLCGYFSDLQGNEILSLCDNNRGCILIGLVTQSHGKMGGVCDDQRCRRNGVDHAAARTVATKRAEARLDQRVAF